MLVVTFTTLSNESAVFRQFLVLTILGRAQNNNTDGKESVQCLHFFDAHRG